MIEELRLLGLKSTVLVAEGAKIIDDSGLKVFSAITLKEAAERVKEVLV